MINKRRAERTTVDLGVTKYIGGEAQACRASEISSTGIRLTHCIDNTPLDQIVEIELPLVEGKLHTQVSAKRVRQNDNYEAFEFVAPSRAQQIMLERVYCNSTYLTKDAPNGLNASPTVQIIRKIDEGTAVSRFPERSMVSTS
jgi:hypothetical protein